MIRVFSAVSAYQGLLRASKFRVGDGSDNDFKKVTKKPAAATEEITQGNVLKVIDEWVHNNNVCLFMKGTPLQPQCGYSKYVVGALTTQGLKNYFSFNILSNPLVREQLKVYSKWPTFPQLYVKGKLVGGCDIVREMQADGSLQKLLKDSGLI